MNASQDKTVLFFPVPVELTTASAGEETSTIRADVSLTAPALQVRLAADLVTDLTATIQLPEGLELLSRRRNHLTNLGASERTIFTWEVRESGRVHGPVRVAVAGIAVSSDPYPFRDIIGTQTTASLRSDAVTMQVSELA